MIRSPWLEESLARAFELAYFIHGDKAAAWRIVAEAMAKLEVVTAAQDKRLYYTPAGRASHANAYRYRNKVNVSELHLLQRLVYVESEAEERQDEEAPIPVSPDEEDMLIRYIKHLVQITTKRNSFHVTLGLSRLLHNYSTAETMELHRVVAQDAERVREDCYYRARKGQLMKELKERFGDRLRAVRGQRGEERFQTDDCHHAGLVRECLRMFTPWKTTCAIPDGFDPFVEEIAALSFDGDDPDEEHEIEVNRFHAVLHPDCLARLAASLNFALPDVRLAAPCFFMARDNDQNRDQGRRPPWNSRRPPKLDEAELNAVKSLLNERSTRRKLAAAGLLRILVNGREHAQLDLNRASQIRFEVGEGDELIEVRAAEGSSDLLLAAHLLRHDDSSEARRPRQTSIILEGGQKISFAIAPVRDALNQSSVTTVDLSYRETRLSRAAALHLRQLAYAATNSWHQRSCALKPALAFALLAIFALGLMLYWRANERQKKPEVVVQQPPAPAVVTTPSPQETISPSRNQPREVNIQRRKERPALDAPPLIVQKDRPGQLQPTKPEETNPQIETGPGETRNPNTRADGVSLSAVKSIHVDLFGDEPLAKQFRDLLMENLRNSPRLTITANRDEADAVLKGKLRTMRGDRISLTVRLVNIQGAVLWPARGPITGKQYQGPAAIVANLITRDLLDDVRRAERK